MELTREKLKNWLSRTERGGLFGSNIVNDLCTALLAEMDKPKVWDGAPDDCTHCQVNFIRHMRAIHSVVYERELPKSRIDEIAEEAVDKYQRGAVGAGSLTDIIKLAIQKDREEREAGEMKCGYCGIDLSGVDDYRRREHRSACKNADAEMRYIHSGIPQKEYPPKEVYVYNRKTGKSELKTH